MQNEASPVSHQAGPSSAPARVVVIGGGPGGSTAATLLAREGYGVVLFERAVFPREHIGESLLPASLPILEDLGVLHDVEAAGFTHKPGATMVWGKDREPWSWYFRETNQRFPTSYQVWRPTFDDLLLQNSRRNGVDVREDHTVAGVVFDGERAVGVEVRGPGGSERVDADFVVDASGQGALIANQLGLREWDPFFQNLAVYAYFDGAKRLPSPDEGNIFIESYEHGWFWVIPLGDRTSVGAVMDRRAGQQQLHGRRAEDVLLEHIPMAPRTAQLLNEAAITSGATVLKDWSYVASRFSGDGYILAGDAACFVDPLFSSGVHLALSAGVLAAAYVTTWIEDRELALAAADVYRELYLRQYNHFHQMASLFYASNRTVESYFWEARRLLDDNVRSPREAFIRAVAGQPPQGYERVVLEKGAAPDAFAGAVSGLEADRERRRVFVDTLITTLDANAAPAFLSAVPVLAPGTALQRKPVLGDGRFEWGYVARADERDPFETSTFVASLLSLCDSNRTVGDIVDAMAERNPGRRSDIMGLAANAVAILYTDGAIATLAARPPSSVPN